MASPEENCFAIFLGQEKLTKFFSGFELWIKPNCNSANNAEQSSARPLKTQNVFSGIANATAHYKRKICRFFCAKKKASFFLWKCVVLNPALHNHQFHPRLLLLLRLASFSLAQICDLIRGPAHQFLQSGGRGSQAA